jgi:hypothetical protein
MIFFYLIALVPCFIGALLWIFNHRVVWWEWMVSAAAGLLVAGIVHYAAIASMTHDTETWSGQMTRAIHWPEWIEEYTVTHTTTDSKGNTSSYTTTHHRTHEQYWEAETTLGQTVQIPESDFQKIRKSFNNLTTETPYKSGFDSGDPNIYVAYNKTGYVYPCTASREFENRVKAAPSVFSFAKVPAGTPVFSYPPNGNIWNSDRVLGTAKQVVGVRAWDLLNSDLGPRKKVNLILIGFGDRGADIAQWQQAAWIGGKKNDLVLCYGGPNEKPTWARVFGWTESELVKANLQTILLENAVSESLLPLIRKEVVANYQIKDWKKFDYITITPRASAWYWLIGTLLITQIGVGYVVFNNEAYK